MSGKKQIPDHEKRQGKRAWGAPEIQEKWKGKRDVILPKEEENGKKEIRGRKKKERNREELTNLAR